MTGLKTFTLQITDNSTVINDDLKLVCSFPTGLSFRRSLVLCIPAENCPLKGFYLCCPKATEGIVLFSRAVRM